MKAVILDAFEVLATIHKPSNPFNKLARKGGMSKHVFEGYVHSRELSLDSVLTAFNASLEEGDLIRQKLELDLQRMTAYPDSKDFLNKLSESGIYWMIISKSPSVYADALLNVLDVSEDKVLFSWVSGDTKPHLFKKACETLGVHPQDALYIYSETAENKRFAPGSGMKQLPLDRKVHNLQDLVILKPGRILIKHDRDQVLTNECDY
jgi:FMN phosphatase YigB (HAD superfamily)